MFWEGERYSYDSVKSVVFPDQSSADEAMARAGKKIPMVLVLGNNFCYVRTLSSVWRKYEFCGDTIVYTYTNGDSDVEIILTKSN